VIPTPSTTRVEQASSEEFSDLSEADGVTGGFDEENSSSEGDAAAVATTAVSAANYCCCCDLSIFFSPRSYTKA
jgi:hypothetical protein